MKNVRALIIVSLAVILTFAIIGCTASPESLLLGKWGEVKEGKKGGPGNILEFLKDGTLIIVIDNSRSKHSVKYRVIDKARMELDMPGAFGGSGKTVVEYAVSQNELIMETGGGGKKEKYTRVKS